MLSEQSVDKLISDVGEYEELKDELESEADRLFASWIHSNWKDVNKETAEIVSDMKEYGSFSVETLIYQAFTDGVKAARAARAPSEAHA